MGTNQEIYDNEAIHYDLLNSMMERMFSHGRTIFKALHGEILEIGTGTGTNLQYYDPSSKITAVDFSPNMVKLARAKVSLSGLTNIRKILVADAQKLDTIFTPSSFDYVTSTCVFCSIPNPLEALIQIRKILRPKGLLVQMEHGRSNIPPVNLFLRIFDPISYKIRGSHIARNHIRILQQANYQIIARRELDPMGMVKILISKPM